MYASTLGNISRYMQYLDENTIYSIPNSVLYKNKKDILGVHHLYILNQ